MKIHDASSQSGLASRITINQDFIVRLQELDTQEGDTAVQKMSLPLKLAATPCHEIAVSTSSTVCNA